MVCLLPRAISCLHRSWTGKAIYRVDFDVNLNGATVREVACASDVLAARDADYEARVLGFLIANLLAEAKCRTISAWRPAYSARSFAGSARA